MNNLFKGVLLLMAIPLLLAVLFYLGGGGSYGAFASIIYVLLYIPAAYGFIALTAFLLGRRAWAKIFFGAMIFLLLLDFCIYIFVTFSMGYR